MPSHDIVKRVREDRDSRWRPGRTSTSSPAAARPARPSRSTQIWGLTPPGSPPAPVSHGERAAVTPRARTRTARACTTPAQPSAGITRRRSTQGPNLVNADACNYSERQLLRPDRPGHLSVPRVARRPDPPAGRRERQLRAARPTAGRTSWSTPSTPTRSTPSGVHQQPQRPPEHCRARPRSSTG